MQFCWYFIYKGLKDKEACPWVMVLNFLEIWVFGYEILGDSLT